MPKSSEILIKRIQELAQLPHTEFTPELEDEYKQNLCCLLVKELDSTNEYGNKAIEALEYFAELIGITPKLITLAQAGEFELARTTLNYWIRAGVLKVRGRQKSAGRGGGTILVAEIDVLRLKREAPGSGRSWSGKRRKKNEV